MALARRTYDGLTLAGLREWAKELAEAGYPIKGRTVLDGDSLLTRVHAVNDRRNRDNELAFMRDLEKLAGGRWIGTLIRSACGDVIRITRTPETFNPGHRTGYTPLFVRGTYISLCDTCAKGYPAGVDHVNRGQVSTPHRFFLNSHTVVSPEKAPAPAPAPQAKTRREIPLFPQPSKVEKLLDELIPLCPDCPPAGGMCDACQEQDWVDSAEPGADPETAEIAEVATTAALDAARTELLPLVGRTRREFAAAAAELDAAQEEGDCRGIEGGPREANALAVKARAAGRLELLREVFDVLGLDWPTAPANTDIATADAPASVIEDARARVAGIVAESAPTSGPHFCRPEPTALPACVNWKFDPGARFTSDPEQVSCQDCRDALEASEKAQASR